MEVICARSQADPRCMRIPVDTDDLKWVDGKIPTLNPLVHAQSPSGFHHYAIDCRPRGQHRTSHLSSFGGNEMAKYVASSSRYPTPTCHPSIRLVRARKCSATPFGSDSMPSSSREISAIAAGLSPCASSCLSASSTIRWSSELYSGNLWPKDMRRISVLLLLGRLPARNKAFVSTLARPSSSFPLRQTRLHSDLVSESLFRKPRKNCKKQLTW